MKINVDREKSGFIPITINVVLDSQKDLDYFMAMINVSIKDIEKHNYHQHFTPEDLQLLGNIQTILFNKLDDCTT